jgi:hypothetical protein
MAGVGMLFLVGCSVGDPGWSYRALKGKAVYDDGLWFVLPDEYGMGPRVHASLFTGSLSIEVDIQNKGDDQLFVDLGGVSVADGASKSLPMRRAVPLPAARGRCGGQQEGVRCILAKGQSCRLSASFQIEPLVPHWLFWQKPNPDLQELSLSVGPLRRAERTIDLHATLVRK